MLWVISMMVLTTSAVSSRRPSLMGPWLMGDSRRPSSSIRFPLCSTKPTKWRSTLSSRAGVAVWPDSAAEVWADSTSLNCERSPARSRGVCAGEREGRRVGQAAAVRGVGCMGRARLTLPGHWEKSLVRGPSPGGQRAGGSVWFAARSW